MNREEIKNQLWECVTLYSGTIEDRYKFFDLLKEYREEDLLKISMLKIRKSKLKESISEFEEYVNDYFGGVISDDDFDKKYNNDNSDNRMLNKFKELFDKWTE